MNRDEEEILIKGCLQNDRRCQEKLYRQFYGKMMAMCLRYTRDADKAMDILNQGFLNVFTHLGNFSFQGSLEGWIRTIIVRSIADYFRSNARYTQHVLMIEKDEHVPEEPLQELYRQDLMEIIESLPEASRVVFNLFAIEGYSHQEIAQMLNISTGTSKWHVSDARQRLKALLKKRHHQVKVTYENE